MAVLVGVSVPPNTSDETRRWLMALDSTDESTKVYEQQVQRVNPTYPQLFTMAATYLLCMLPETANILVVGAGGGQELVRFGYANPKWSLTGVDPSPVMIDMARQRVESLGLSKQVRLFEGIVEGLPHDQYDAATSLLVLHFLPEAQKISMLRTIYENLKPGAPFILASLVGTLGSLSYKAHLSAWLSYMADAGVGQDVVDSQQYVLEHQWHLISENHLYDLLHDAGFSNVEPFYYSYLFGGWIAFKEK